MHLSGSKPSGYFDVMMIYSLLLCCAKAKDATNVAGGTEWYDKILIFI